MSGRKGRPSTHPGSNPVPAAASGPPGTGPAAAGLVDPRAVRVAVVVTGRSSDDPTLTVSPLPVPVLRPVDRLAGTAILGGIPGPATTPGGGDGRRQRRSRGHPASRAASDPETTTLLVDGAPATVAIEVQDPEHVVLVEGSAESGRRTRVVLGPERRREEDGLVTREVVIDGWRVEVELEPERRASLRERARRASDVGGRTGPVEVRAIIPGRIVALSVGAGDAVTAGQQLLVLEAMKMQNELRAPREGTIERIPIAVGENVEVGDLLMVIS
jgi:biotin carboxyl carrier protein